MSEKQGKVYVFDHPLIQHKVSMMRKKETNVKEFREMATEVATLMGYEATRDLPLEDVEIETPMCKTTVRERILPSFLSSEPDWDLLTECWLLFQMQRLVT